MLISELNFPHLTAAREERLTAQLERRRVVAERLAEQARTTTSERMPRSRRGAAAHRRADTAEARPA